VITGNPLHIMAKPGAGDARRAMSRLAWMSPKRSPEALHWTVIPDQGGSWTIETVAAVLDGMDADPFTLVFDQACGRVGGTAEIHCRRVPRGATRLVKSLCEGFERAGITIKRQARPHVTLDCRWAGENFDTPIAPIVWDVDRIQLVESITERRSHLAHGEWPLVPRQGTLFPLKPCDGRGGTLAPLHG
jgi:RNA 2',3'-cyclic 3'-phosphodiesterase